MCCNLVFLCLFFIISCLIIKYEEIKLKIIDFWVNPHRKKTSFSCPKQLQSS